MRSSACGAPPEPARTSQRLGASWAGRPARRGDFDAALALFDEAKADQLAHGQPGEVLATDVMTAEVLAMAGRTAEAFALAEDALARVADIDGGGILIPAIQRARGWASLRSGDRDAARADFAAARSGADVRSDAYQAAQAIEGQVAVGRAEGTDVRSLEAELREIRGRLGIIDAASPLVTAAAQT